MTEPTLVSLVTATEKKAPPSAMGALVRTAAAFLPVSTFWQALRKGADAAKERIADIHHRTIDSTVPWSIARRLVDTFDKGTSFMSEIVDMGRSSIAEHTIERNIQKRWRSFEKTRWTGEALDAEREHIQRETRRAMRDSGMTEQEAIRIQDKLVFELGRRAFDQNVSPVTLNSMHGLPFDASETLYMRFSPQIREDVNLYQWVMEHAALRMGVMPRSGAGPVAAVFGFMGDDTRLRAFPMCLVNSSPEEKAALENVANATGHLLSSYSRQGQSSSFSY